MKREYYVLFIIIMIIICGCTNHEIINNSIFSFDNSSQEDMILMSSRRAYRESSQTVLCDSYDSDSMYAYMKNESFYYYKREQINGSVTGVLRSYDLNFNETEIIIPVISDQGSAYTPTYVYPLSNDRYLCLYNTGTLKGCIMQTNGEILLAKTLCNDTAFEFVSVEEEPDGTLHLLICTRDKTDQLWDMFYFDEALIRRQTITDSPIYPEQIAYLGKEVFRIGNNLQNIMIIDMNTGLFCSEALRLPSEYRLCGFCTGGNGELYLLNRSEITRYRDGNLPKTVLKNSECDVPYEDNGIHDIWILNDSTLFYTNQESNMGRSNTVLYAVSVKEVPTSVQSRQTISVTASSDHANKWLNHAIRRFNQISDQYYVDLTVYHTKQPEDETSIIQNALLFDSKTDILMPSDANILLPYFDKGAFVDLLPYFGNIILGNIRNGFSYNDELSVIPLQSGYITLLTTEVFNENGTITWENMFEMADSLNSEEVLISPRCYGLSTIGVDYSQVIPHFGDPIPVLYENAVKECVNYETNSSTFDSDEFRVIINRLTTLSDYIDSDSGGISLASDKTALISGQSFLQRLRAGYVKLIELEITDINDFSVLQRCFDNMEFSICGYPTASGYLNLVQYNESISSLFVSVLNHSDAKEGCLAFLEFLLSDEMQMDERHQYLPVTISSIEGLLNRNRYQYYIRDELELMESGLLPFTFLTIPGTTAEYRDDYGLMENTESIYDVFTYSKDDRQQIMEFFSSSVLSVYRNETIMSIINEELSYWKNNARTLEETTKIIDSRVWIYLNE